MFSRILINGPICGGNVVPKYFSYHKNSAKLDFLLCFLGKHKQLFFKLYLLQQVIFSFVF